MRVCALASGSSGNCFYVENEKSDKAILIDAGISCKQIELRLNSIGKNTDNIRAIFLTHEHSDHIKGVDVFARKFNVPIFATKKTCSRFICKKEELIHNIKNNENVKFGKMEINAFSKVHLAGEPVSYNFIENDKKLSIITDAGHACKNIIENVSTSDFLCLESNYDEKMLEEGFYPWPTKKWIKSDEGHLSNVQSAACVLENSSRKLKHVMLSHISANNNTPEIALKTHNYFMSQRKDIKPEISVSVRQFATPLFMV